MPRLTLEAAGFFAAVLAARPTVSAMIKASGQAGLVHMRTCAGPVASTWLSALTGLVTGRPEGHGLRRQRQMVSGGATAPASAA